MCLLSAFLLAVLVVTLFPLAPTHAAPPNAPTLQGYYIVGRGAALVAVGYIGWLGVWTAAPNGTSVYSNTFYLGVFNLREISTNLSIAVEVSGIYVLNTSVVVYPVTEVGVTLTLAQNTAWSSTVLWFDGTPYWFGKTATPISLLPDYILNIGGLDVLALSIVSLTAISLVGGIALARRVMKRAVWAPPFRVLVWWHVLLAVIASAVFLDFQFIDATFAGWSPLVYPWAIFPMAFLSGLSYFNRAHRIELIQGYETPMGDLGVRRTEVRVGYGAGKLQAIDESWGGFWARYWNHPTVIDDADPNRSRVLLLPVETVPNPLLSPARRRKLRKELEHGAPSTVDALTRFPVEDLYSRKETIDYLAFVKSTEPIEPQVRRAHLRWTRQVTKDAVYAFAPNGERYVKRPARVVTRPSFPHYVDPAKPLSIELEDRHYWPAVAAWLGYATPRDLGHIISKLRQENSALKGSFLSRVADEVESQTRTLSWVVGRATSGITDEEAEEIVRRAKAYLGAKGEGP